MNIKCDNFELCETILPDWWFECKGTMLCLNCHCIFGTWGDKTGKGTLDFCDNLECPICLENTRCVSQPNCNHYTCIICFKRCYFNKEYPPFPYTHLEEEYENDINNDNYVNNSKWDSYRKKIDEYILVLDKIDDENNYVTKKKTN